MTIYVTEFDPKTKEVTRSATDSGFSSIDEVTMVMGTPITRGARTATYPDQFFSEYQLHLTADGHTFFNRGH